MITVLQSLIIDIEAVLYVFCQYLCPLSLDSLFPLSEKLQDKLNHCHHS